MQNCYGALLGVRIIGTHLNIAQNYHYKLASYFQFFNAGGIELENLILKKTALQGFELPIEVRSGMFHGKLLNQARSHLLFNFKCLPQHEKMATLF